MIDIHSHILPGVDDGSEDARMSRALLDMLFSQGVEVVAATPHFYADADTPEKFLLRREAAAAALEYDPGTAPRIILGAEVAYFDGLGRSASLKQMQLGDSGLLLVEMPFKAWTERMVDEICNLSLLADLTPVLAHVNRYLRRDQLPRFQNRLLEHGVLFQCNAEAFTGPLSERRWALSLLKQGGIHFLGSDTHNLTTRPPNMDQAARIISRKLGSGFLQELAEQSRQLLKL